ncbi:Uncharacterised protein [Halioglobus japonicus]|nr:Uncharacterised protein [Halioglobus japonicus]
MTTRLPTRPGAALNWLYLLCVAVFVIAIAQNHWQLIAHAFPLDYNEGGMLVTTSTILQGGNPYSIASQPTHISLYPVLYNIVVAPLASVFGNTFELHRAVSGFFILACCALCFYLCRKESAGRVESLTAAAMLYAAMLYYSTPVASTNSFGLFLFLAAITIPWVNAFSTRSLAVAIVLGVLAFYTKQYFVACLGYVALYVFLAVSKKRAIYFGVAATVVFIAVLAWVCYTSPYYLEATFFAVRGGYRMAASDAHVFTQLQEYALIYLPVLVILVGAIAARWYFIIALKASSGEAVRGDAAVNLARFDKPLLQVNLNYIWFCLACSLIIFVLVLGKNRGNHLTYLFQLVSPFLLVGVFALISDMPKARWPFRILTLLAFYNSYAMLPTDFSVEDKGWQAIRSEIAGADDIYASTLVLEEIIEKDGPIYLSGGTRYFIFGGDKPAFLKKANEQDDVLEVWERFVKQVQTKIETQQFDLLLIDNKMNLPQSLLNTEVNTKAILKEHYQLTANVKLPLMDRLGGGNFRMQVWKPIVRQE